MLARDKYISSEFQATDFSFPHAQAVRGEENTAHCGYFVPLPQAQKADWCDLETAQTITYTYNDGKTNEGILLTEPRMVLCAVSKLGLFDRAASQEGERLVVMGEYDAQLNKDSNVGTFQIYLVMFLDKCNFPLHQIPLKVIAKGAHQATLSKYWEQNCIQVAMLHAKAAKVPFRPRDERYKALCVFEPVIKRMLAGNGKAKSPACCIDGFTAPTIGTWKSFFLGEAEELLAETILQMLNPQPRALLMSPSADSTIALAPQSDAVPDRTAPRQIAEVKVEPVREVVTAGAIPTIDRDDVEVDDDVDFGYRDDMPF